MTKEEAFDVLDAIQEFYPNVKMGERKIRVFIPQLLKTDYEGVMEQDADVIFFLYRRIIMNGTFSIIGWKSLFQNIVMGRLGRWSCCLRRSMGGLGMLGRLVVEYMHFKQNIC